METPAVEPVEDGRGLRAFLRFPERLYRNDPCWVPPLRRDERARLSPSNPFFAHAEARLFLARQGGEVVGRVAAIVDRWHLERWKDGAGFFGFFEAVADDAVAISLLDAVRDWLRSRGLQVVRGPFSPSTHDECGLLCEGFEQPPRILMPYNQPYYPALLEQAGFRVIRELLTYEMEVPPALPERVIRVARTAEERGVRVRPVDRARLTAETEVFRTIYNAAWSDNWGFVPMSQAEAAAMASRLRQILIPELALFAEWKSQPVGFLLLLPDLNPALRLLRGRVTPWGLVRFLWRQRRVDEVRLLVLGVLPEYRRRGIEALLLREVYGPVRRLGYRRAELGWVLDDNAVTRQTAERWGAWVAKRYRIYEGAV
jgi:GNAT superfamily N-acetyltransferase